MRNKLESAFAFLLLLAITPALAQNCRWAGTGPWCNGECSGGETELTRLDGIPNFWVPPFVYVNPPFGSNCFFGSKALCCQTMGRSCRWDGTAPFCAGECLPGESAENPPGGSQSGRGCVTGSKVYCCRDTSSVRLPLTGTRDCSYGPDTCIQGFVWREASPQDHVCVTPQVREQARLDNAQATARRSGFGDYCIQGFVWREAFPGDHVCVTPQTRSQAIQDNKWRHVRDACP